MVRTFAATWLPSCHFFMSLFESNFIIINSTLLIIIIQVLKKLSMRSNLFSMCRFSSPWKAFSKIMWDTYAWQCNKNLGIYSFRNRLGNPPLTRSFIHPCNMYTWRNKFDMYVCVCVCASSVCIVWAYKIKIYFYALIPWNIRYGPYIEEGRKSS